LNVLRFKWGLSAEFLDYETRISILKTFCRDGVEIPEDIIEYVAPISNQMLENLKAPSFH
jgi:chromosomal replication initiation ATPase DnaA